MRAHRRPVPLWLHLLVATTAALLLRAYVPLPRDAAIGPLQPGQHAFAFWFAVILIGELIWKGIEAAGQVSLIVLHWMIINLSFVVSKITNTLASTGFALLQGLKRGWDFLRVVYDDVLKPAWSKFWTLFDRLTTWLTKTFTPVLKWLLRVRKFVVDAWTNFVRPWLDLIDVTRKALQLLGDLGVSWARALDARLQQIEQAIEKPFLWLVAKLNEVIGIVNLVITADGLIQRIAFVRTLARDYEYAWRAIANPYRKAPDPATKKTIDDAFKPRTAAQIAAALNDYTLAGGGDRADMYAALDAFVRREFGGA